MTMRKLWIIIVVLIIFSLPYPAHAQNRMWWATGLTGGGASLDGIDGNSLTAGDGGIVAYNDGTNDNIYFYRLKESGTAESSPSVISPDTNAGTKRWHLTQIVGQSLETQSSDGYNRMAITNNTSRSPAAASMELYPEGNIWKANENGTEYGLILQESICVSLGDWSAEISDGTKWDKAFRVPYQHILTKIILTTNQVAGDITIDVWADTASATTGLANIAVGDSLFDVVSNPTIADASSDNYVETTSFDTGEDAGDAGTWYVINVDSCTTLTGVNICFEFIRVN